MTPTKSATKPAPRQVAAEAAVQHDRVMAAIEDHFLEHGVAPSVEQLSTVLGMPSAQVRTSLTALVEAGKIRRGKAGGPS